MVARTFDAPELLAALRGYLAAHDRLEEVAASGSARDVVDEAEAKSVAAMRLRRELVEQGWTAPRHGAAGNPADGVAPPSETSVEPA